MVTGACPRWPSPAVRCTASSTPRRWPVPRSSRPSCWPVSPPTARRWCPSRSPPGPTPRRCWRRPGRTSPSSRSGAGRAVRVRRSTLQCGAYTVPGDPSQAAFWVVGSVIIPGSLVTVTGIYLSAERLGFIGVLRRMGATIEVEEAGSGTGSVTGYTALCTAPWSSRRRSPPSTRCPSWRWRPPPPPDNPVPRRGRAAGQGVRPAGRHGGAGAGVRGRGRGRRGRSGGGGARGAVAAGAGRCPG